jgi:hypothetical protein
MCIYVYECSKNDFRSLSLFVLLCRQIHSCVLLARLRATFIIRLSSMSALVLYAYSWPAGRDDCLYCMSYYYKSICMPCHTKQVSNEQRDQDNIVFLVISDHPAQTNSRLHSTLACVCAKLRSQKYLPLNLFYDLSIMYTDVSTAELISAPRPRLCTSLLY